MPPQYGIYMLNPLDFFKTQSTGHKFPLWY